MPEQNCDNLEVGYKRAFVFLQLAIEQLRQYDPQAAEVISVCALQPISTAFEHVIDQYQRLRLSPKDEALIRSLEMLAKRAFDIATEHVGPAPPGLGQGVLTEGAPHYLNDLKAVQDSLNEWSSSRFDQTNNQEIHKHSAAPFGVIGEQFTSKTRQESFTSPNGQPRTTNLPNHYFDSPLSLQKDLLDGGNRGRWVEPLKAIAEQAKSRSRSRGEREHEGSVLAELSPRSKDAHKSGIDVSAHELDYRTRGLPRGQSACQNNPSSSSVSNFESENTSPHFNDTESLTSRKGSTQKQVKAVTSTTSPYLQVSTKKQKSTTMTKPTTVIPLTWAKVAAITSEDPKKKSEFNGEVTTSLSTTQSRLNATPQWLQLRNNETENDRHRVVWISNIPPSCKARDISAGIVEGAVMSLTLQYYAKPPLKGHSACVIFQNAENAAAFLNAATQGYQPKFPTTAPAAEYISGEPFPMDEDLAIMAPPINARRRIKFARARLFYELSMTTFKRDIISLCGQPVYMELIHFYNAGECTVVFASVRVASHVLGKFEEWKKDMSNQTMYARYKGVDVAFARDFNEAPATLYTQYTKSGVLAGGRVEGLYPGPTVSEEQSP